MYHYDVQQIEHEAMSITKYFETRRVKDRQTTQKKQKMSKHFRVMQSTPNANYFSSQCSDENYGNIFGLCGFKL